jgi:hypothetical protein
MGWHARGCAAAIATLRMDIPRTMKQPIISFNRLAALRQCIDSFRHIVGHRLVIHDAGFTYEPLLDYLDELAREGVS